MANYNATPNKLNLMYSYDFTFNVRLKISTLEGPRQKPNYRDLIEDPLLRYSGSWQEDFPDLYVTFEIFSDGTPLSLPVQTSYKSFSNRWDWNEWLTMPVQYSDLPRNTMLAFTIWDIYKPHECIPIGGTTVSLFGKHGALRQGIIDLKVWPNVKADGNVNTQTPGKVGQARTESARLSKLVKKYNNGQIPKIDWLDRLAFREIHNIFDKEKRDSESMYLSIEFPKAMLNEVEYTIFYFEKEADQPCQERLDAKYVVIADPEIGMENLVESKHHRLARSEHADKDIKPNSTVRDQLNLIVKYPPTQVLTSEDQDLVWKFRLYLKDQKKALPKFLKCVNWNQPNEVKLSSQLLGSWQAMDVEDALELLSSYYSHPIVRRYAVMRLQQAPNEDLQLYLLQLVQALKYENFKEIKALERKESLSSERSTSIVSEAARNRTESSLSDAEEPEDLSSIPEDVSHNIVLECDLATFLITRACADDHLANYFYWYLHVECEDQESSGKDTLQADMYKTVMRRFNHMLNNSGRAYRIRRATLARQQAFVERLTNLMKKVARESGNRKKKMDRLQALLTEESNKFSFTSFDPFPLPLDPSVKVKGILPDKACLFKSNLMPCRLHFVTVDDEEYVAIFKHGDDLRQDQLILQTITLMDKLLRKENLDLKLTPYRVLASSTKHGFVQFIDSIPVAEVLNKEDSIQNFFRKHAPSESGPYGIASEVMDSYIKSCAGYCVITYILGVGDRHLDNLLLTKTGKLFHVDFGYILGRDPKPLPAPMKLSKEMVEGMGGIHSEHYNEFRNKCYTAFLHLRRHANLFINLFTLMMDASIPDIALEPDKTVKKVQDKFMLSYTDEQALCFMQNLIEESVSAVMPAIVERLHMITQYLRK